MPDCHQAKYNPAVVSSNRCFIFISTLVYLDKKNIASTYFMVNKFPTVHTYAVVAIFNNKNKLTHTVVVVSYFLDPAEHCHTGSLILHF